MPRITEPTIRDHRAKVLQRLLAAWAELIVEQGYAATTLAQVAERAGVARNTVYGYVTDKEELLLTYVEHVVDRFVRQITVDVDATVGAEARMRLLVERQVADFAASACPWHDLTGLLGPEAEQAMSRHNEPVRRLVARILREGVYEGVFRDLDVDATVPLVMGVLNAARPRVAAGDDIAAVGAHCWDFIRHAVAAGPAPSPTARRPGSGRS